MRGVTLEGWAVMSTLSCIQQQKQLEEPGHKRWWSSPMFWKTGRGERMKALVVVEHREDSRG